MKDGWHCGGSPSSHAAWRAVLLWGAASPAGIELLAPATEKKVGR
jgi:acid phosphatase family membrane protein YuiD